MYSIVTRVKTATLIENRLRLCRLDLFGEAPLCDVINGMMAASTTSMGTKICAELRTDGQHRLCL